MGVLEYLILGVMLGGWVVFTIICGFVVRKELREEREAQEALRKKK